jgi:hypothetical protein
MIIEQRQAEACFDAAVDKHVGANVVLKAIRFTNSNAVGHRR